MGTAAAAGATFAGATSHASAGAEAFPQVQPLRRMLRAPAANKHVIVFFISNSFYGCVVLVCFDHDISEPFM